MWESCFGLFFFLKQPENQKNDERYVYLRTDSYADSNYR